ncbi:MAG TPA: stage II sporulation protein D [Clostridiaceae bacterium]|jgi:stage II sporulation protein D|nr:stage II sporulation protein D [Clostridiaceae bacterium]
MKKIAVYILVMVFAIIVLPMIIVKGCNFSREVLVPEDKSDNIRINVFVSQENQTVEMELEEYIKGVVAAEMPAEFELEALKAQAVAARTYTYSRMNGLFLPSDNPHEGAVVCTDHTHCQAWRSIEDAKAEWGKKWAEYWNKVEEAVNATHGIVITYNNELINPVFHSNSGGRTENAEEVWACDPYPYLVSVESMGDEQGENYFNYIIIEEQEFISKLREKFPGIVLSASDILNDVSIESYSEGGRVKTIRIGSETMKGTEFRNLFSLKSTNFQISRESSTSLRITTIGYGHGVGMSQWGANYMAKQGESYEKILKYYYRGVELRVIQ